MKILCTADYHISNWLDYFRLKEQIEGIEETYDLVIAAGDLFEAEFFKENNPYHALSELFPDTIVVAILGNHEFIGQKYIDVMNVLKKSSRPWNVHYLDVDGKFEHEDFNFVGNVFWYDDSMAIHSQKSDYNFKNKLLSDYTFNPRWKFDECSAQIFLNYDLSKKNILVTHTCPHELLNGLLLNEEAANAYSGSCSYLESLKFEFSICGHTHYQIETVVNGKPALNVGASKDNFLWKIFIAS